MFGNCTYRLALILQMKGLDGRAEGVRKAGRLVADLQEAGLALLQREVGVGRALKL